MQYLREDMLRDYLRDRRLDRNAQRKILREAREKGDEDVFLSHAHRDQELVAAVVAWLYEHGIRVYVDWMDPEMPESACAETAVRVKQKIGNCKSFLCLVTNTALRSKWVPWEIGVGDTLKGPDNVYLIPVADPNGEWDGAEFLQLYPAIGPSKSALTERRARPNPLRFQVPYPNLRPDIYAGGIGYPRGLRVPVRPGAPVFGASGQPLRGASVIEQAAPLISRPNGQSERRLPGYTW